MLRFIDLRSRLEVSSPPALSLCLGNFDGVHIGHASLIREALDKKRRLESKYPGIIGGAWLFAQPPADFLISPPPPHITSLEDKLELFRAAGLSLAVVADFKECSNFSPAEFVELLCTRCNCKAAVCGFNFRFAKDASGTPDDLVGIPDGVSVMPPVKLADTVVSSSEIRRLIINGDTETAARLLGRPFSVRLTVRHGRQIGRQIGAPTINQAFPERSVIPASGVYATRATVDGIAFDAVTNVGTNPTVSHGSETVCETHLLAFSGDLYAKIVKIEFFKHMRAEKKFDNVHQLSQAIANDIANVIEYFKATPHSSRLAP